MPQTSSIFDLARKPVVADLLSTFGGRVAQMLFALVGSILSARALGPADLGRFGVVIAIVMVCGTLADAGLTYSAIKFIAQHSSKDDGKAFAVARAYFSLRIGTGMFAALVGVLFAEPIAKLVLGQAELAPYLQLSFLTLAGLSISSYPNTVLIGLSLFGRLGVASALNAAITLAGILLLSLTGNLSLGTLIAWNVALPIVSTLPAWLLLPAGWLPWHPASGSGAPSSRREAAGQVLGFSKWIALSNLASIIAVQGDMLLLGRLSEPAVVGVYSVALALALKLDTLNQSLLTVMLPRASRLQGPSDIRRYSRRVLVGSGGLACLLGVFALLAQPLVALLYGEQYALSTELFLALTPVVLFDLITSSLFLLAYPLNRPRLLAVSGWLRVGVLGMAGWLLIPLYAGFGAAAARFVSSVAGAAYSLPALRRAANSAENEQT